MPHGVKQLQQAASVRDKCLPAGGRWHAGMDVLGGQYGAAAGWGSRRGASADPSLCAA